MITIFWRAIRDRKVSLIVYMAAAMLFMWMYVAMFPSIAEQAEAFTAVFENFPPAVFEIFGIEDLHWRTSSLWNTSASSCRSWPFFC